MQGRAATGQQPQAVGKGRDPRPATPRSCPVAPGKGSPPRPRRGPHLQGGDVLVVELVLAVAQHQGGFPHAALPEQYHLEGEAAAPGRCAGPRRHPRPAAEPNRAGPPPHINGPHRGRGAPPPPPPPTGTGTRWGAKRGISWGGEEKGRWCRRGPGDTDREGGRGTENQNVHRNRRPRSP